MQNNSSDIWNQWWYNSLSVMKGVVMWHCQAYTGCTKLNEIHVIVHEKVTSEGHTQNQR